MRLRIGTRSSMLARAQSERVGEALVKIASEPLEIEYVEIVTHGDRTVGSLVGLSETGVFVTALRTAILDDKCDLLVHSLKDMPVAPYPGLTVAAIPERADARDVLCTAPSREANEADDADAENDPVAALPAGAVVGTSSPRRAAQMRAVRADLHLQEIRGNVDSRLARLGGDFDAIVLAAAGLERLGRLSDVTYFFDVQRMLPAPGQGALAVEIREDAPPQVRALVESLDHVPTRACVTAERTALEVLQAGCAAPVGAYAECRENEISLRVRVITQDGSLALNEKVSGPVALAESLGRRAAYALLGRGAASLMGRS